MTTSSDKFADAVIEAARPGGSFEATASYIPEGDCIEFVAAPDDYYAERIDGLVTVYHSRETGEIMGSLIKSVRTFCRNMLARYPGFKIEIEEGPVKLEHLFLAQLWSQERQPGDIAVRTYRRLIEVAEKTGVSAEVSLV